MRGWFVVTFFFVNRPLFEQTIRCRSMDGTDSGMHVVAKKSITAYEWLYSDVLGDCISVLFSVVKLEMSISIESVEKVLQYVGWVNAGDVRAVI